MKIPLNPRSQQLQDFLTEAKPSKYRNRKTVVDGLTFDSAKESRRYLELKALERAGHIRDLNRQVTMPLKVNGVLVCSVRPDFTYTRCDEKVPRFVVEDVKSPATRKIASYRIKYKLFAALHGFNITEV